MGKKCCKSDPPCKGCPKLKKKKKKHGKCDAACQLSGVSMFLWPMSRSGADA